MKIKAKILKDEPFLFEFELEDINVGMANGIRRFAMNRVKTFAIDEVTFYENSSNMWDEYIAHRIGLIPIKSSGKHSENEEVLFSLEEEGPKTVYSGSLKSNDKDVKVANEKIPIVKLNENERLKLDGKAVLRNALVHAKFQPALVSYEYDEKEPSKFKFFVESFQQMPAKEVLKKALEEIKSDAEALRDQL